MNRATAVGGWYLLSGYTFVMDAAVTGNGGVSGGQFGDLDLWGFGNGGLNTITVSPDRGNFIAQDGAFEQTPFQHDITGLVIGKTYKVDFNWAAAQQSGFTGDTTER